MIINMKCYRSKEPATQLYSWPDGLLNYIIKCLPHQELLCQSNPSVVSLINQLRLIKLQRCKQQGHPTQWSFFPLANASNVKQTCGYVLILQGEMQKKGIYLGGGNGMRKSETAKEMQRDWCHVWGHQAQHTAFIISNRITFISSFTNGAVPHSVCCC